MSGDCFLVAAQLARMLAASEHDVMLVHGLPRFRGREHDGKRFWHAWVEVEVNNPPPLQRSRTVWCVDKANGKDVDLPRDAYYRLGDLDEEHVFRYTVEEAEEHLYETDLDYGPWVPGHGEMGDL